MVGAKVDGADTVYAGLVVKDRTKALETEGVLPPPYSSQPVLSQGLTPDVDIGTTSEAHTVFDKLDFTPSPLELPTVAECIVHLKLLHAFAKLRYHVGNQEGIFGIDLEKCEDAMEEEPEGGASHQPSGIHAQH